MNKAKNSSAISLVFNSVHANKVIVKKQDGITKDHIVYKAIFNEVLYVLKTAIFPIIREIMRKDNQIDDLLSREFYSERILQCYMRCKTSMEIRLENSPKHRWNASMLRNQNLFKKISFVFTGENIDVENTKRMNYKQLLVISQLCRLNIEPNTKNTKATLINLINECAIKHMSNGEIAYMVKFFVK